MNNRREPKVCEDLSDGAIEFFNKGVDLEEEGKYEDAIESYERVLGLNPECLEAWTNKAADLIELKKYKEAEDACNVVLESGPACPCALNNKAVSLGEQGRYEECLSAIEEGLALEPDGHNLWYNKVVFLTKMGKEDESIQAYLKLQDLKEKSSRGSVQQVQTDKKQGMCSKHTHPADGLRFLGMEANKKRGEH